MEGWQRPLENLELAGSQMFRNRFDGKRVLITGHTGFKGSWLSEWLLSLHAEVFGFSLAPDANQKLFVQLRLEERLSKHVEGDVRDGQLLNSVIKEIKPDFVFHLAAQPLVIRSYEEPSLTFQTNINGTSNVLESLRHQTNPCTVIVVTTDKCYENREWLHAYRESDALGGHDPYSASKACAEIVTHSYRRSFFNSDSPIRVGTARAGNVIGGGDWSADRIVPDIVRAIQSSIPVEVRNRFATRPWQHVLEPLSGYLWQAAELSGRSDLGAEDLKCFNFGPGLKSNRSVAELVEEFLKHTSGTWIDKTDHSQVHEANRLNLSIEQAYHVLEWLPCWGFDMAVARTWEWYQAEWNGVNTLEITQQQISQYTQDANKKAVAWAHQI